MATNDFQQEEQEEEDEEDGIEEEEDEEEEGSDEGIGFWTGEKISLTWMTFLCSSFASLFVLIGLSMMSETEEGTHAG